MHFPSTNMFPRLSRDPSASVILDFLGVSDYRSARITQSCQSKTENHDKHFTDERKKVKGYRGTGCCLICNTLTRDATQHLYNK